MTIQDPDKNNLGPSAQVYLYIMRTLPWFATSRGVLFQDTLLNFNSKFDCAFFIFSIQVR